MKKTPSNFIFMIVVFAFLTSCQSADTNKVLDDETLLYASPEFETVGTGSVHLHMFLNRSGKYHDDANAENFRNGAVLAMQDLGTKFVTLHVIDVKSDLKNAETQLAAALKNDSSLLIVNGESGLETAAIKAATAKKLPIFSLAPSSEGKAYRFLPSGVDSLVSSISYAIDQGKQRVAFFVPKDQKNLASSILKMASHGRTISSIEIPYTTGVNAKILVKQNLATLTEADIIVFGGTDLSIGQIRQEINTSLGAKNQKQYIARNDLPAALLTNPTMDGVIVATIDEANLQLIQSRYVEKFSKPMPKSVIYSYDMIAIAAGMVRAKGKAGISPSSLETISGFRAASGAFRLMPKGRVERIYKISILKNGKFETLKPASSTF